MKTRTTKNSRTDDNNYAHPIPGESAYILEEPPGTKGNVLILADLHYGIEYSLAQAGAHLPSQTKRITEKILTLCSDLTISKLIILGDIKHTVPNTSWQERYELPEVFAKLAKAVKSIEIIPGNHDGNLRRLIPNSLKQIQFHPNSGAVLHNIGLFHGHTWPAPNVLQATQVLMAHNHPKVLFIDKLGSRVLYSCWVRGRLILERAASRYPNIRKPGPEIIIMPAFNDIGSGTPVNALKPEFLGPILKNGYIDLDDSKIYLLDGTDLGELRDLINLSTNSE